MYCILQLFDFLVQLNVSCFKIIDLYILETLLNIKVIIDSNYIQISALI